MNGSTSPSVRSGASGTATPTTPRESVSSATSPSPLSPPGQTTDHKQDYGFSTDANFQTNIGRMPRRDEEQSPKSVPAKFWTKQTRSENEPLSTTEAEESAKDMLKGLGGDVHK
jgi:hypothetical protein